MSVVVFLSRAAFQALHGELIALREENTRLVNEIVAMKRDGFARPQPQVLAHVESGLDDRIMAAIRAMAGPGTSLERDLMTFAEASILGGAEVEDVADQILSGGAVPGDY